MTHEAFQRVAELFREASRLRGEARRAFLDEAAAGDAALRDKVERLLAADDDVPSFLEDEALAAGAFRRAAEALEGDDVLHPERIGDYEILGVLGRGGMGIVYRAQRPGRPVVALKVIRSGLLTPETLRRFELEAQVLSRLRHRGIARILDLGTFEGEDGPRPYFALEHVDGLPLGEFVETRGLDTAARLRLLREVCDAVQYAHTKGVIHRDLKPANILVDESLGQPKVLDFGVARATDLERVATTLRTSTGQLVGTLQYMSPEQVGADPHDIDTRCDVYALGVIAFELVTRRLPYDLEDLPLPDAARVIREQDPRRPSTLDRTLRGDLETIILKAIEKDRERRYQSPSALASDLTRYVGGEAIEARRDSALYLARKLASRHRGTLAAALGFLILGAAILGLMVYQSIDRSRRAAEALEWAALFFDEEAAADPFREGPRTTPAKLAAFSARVDESLDDLPLVEANSRKIIGIGYYDLGMYPEAETQFATAVARRRSVDDRPHEELARDLELLARAQYQLCRYEDSTESYEQVVSMRRALSDEPGVELATAIDGLAACLKRRCRFTDAEAHYREAMEMRRSLLGDDDPWIAASMNNRATCMLMQGRVDDAETLFREALERAERAGVKPLFIARGWRNVARCRLQRGDVDEAERILLDAMETLEKAGHAGHPDVHATEELLGRCALARGDLDGAAHIGHMALRGQLRTLTPPHDGIARTRTLLALVQLERGRSDEAERLLQPALEDRRALFTADHPRLLATHRILAEARFQQDRLDEARDICERVLRAQRRVLDEGEPEIWATLTLLGRVLVALGQPAAAEPLLRQAVRLAGERLPAAHWTVVRGQLALAECLAAQSRFDEATTLVRRAEEAMRVASEVPEHRGRRVRETLEVIIVARGEGGRGS